MVRQFVLATAAVVVCCAWAKADDVLLLNDTFDVGAAPTIGNDGDDPLDAAWIPHFRTPGLTRVNDNTGIGAGFAMNVDTAATFSAVQGDLSVPAWLLIGESVTLQADMRFTQPPANNNVGWRIGLFELNAAGDHDSIGYFAGIGTGTDTSLAASFDNGGAGPNSGGSGTDTGTLTGGGTGAAFGGIGNLTPHSVTLQVTRTGATTASVFLDVDGVTRTGTDSGAIAERFDTVIVREGNIISDFRIDNIAVTHNQHLRHVVTGSAADMEVQQLFNGNTTQLVDGNNMLVGHGGPNGGWGRDALLLFELPSQNSLADDFAASLEFNLVQKDGDLPFDADLYGLGFTTDENDLSSFDDYFHTGIAPLTATLLQDSILDADTELGRIETTGASDQALADFIQALFDAGAQAGDFAVLSLNPSANPFTGTFDRYHIASGGTATSPSLILQASEVVPEPASFAIWSLIGFGLAGFGYYRFKRKKLASAI